MKKAPLFFSYLLAFFIIMNFVPDALGAQPISLDEGISQYREENYEEAIEILTKVREKEPSSSLAAFYLGMAFKQTLDYEKAVANLRDAVTLPPGVKNALVELIGVLYETGKTDEAKRWIQVAEKEKLVTPNLVYLKGLILAKENKNREAIEAFETAQKMDPGLSQTCEFQIGICYLNEKKLEMAKIRFQTSVAKDPLSDWASYARQYQDVVEQTMYQERPLRLTIGLFAGYDTNIVSKPTEESVAGGITDESGSVLNSSARVDYIPKLEGAWLFNAQYAFSSTINSRHTHSHDSLSNSFFLSPGYNFGRFALYFNMGYTNTLLRNDPNVNSSTDSESNPGYKRYLDYTTFGPALRFFISQTNNLEFFVGYDKKEYFNQKISSNESDKDVTGVRAYASWIWLFRENAFLNLRYEFNKDHADGIWWENEGNRFTANVSIPLLDQERTKRFGALSLQLTGGAFFQDFKFDQSYQEKDGSTQNITRRDKVFNGSVGLNWVFWKDTSLIVQVTRTKADSNIPAYEYTRNLYSAGFEFRF
ncbi:MAG: tetratricopeptide repeat protein [Deltaproteobacteria bacterium]|nr:tetratricopeptide repeat protein [Deltaproteobacteria bacterium]